MTKSQSHVTLSANGQMRPAGWVRLSARHVDKLRMAQQHYGLDLSPTRGRAAIEEGGFLVIPMEIVIRQGDHYLETTIVIALGKQVIISVEQDVHLNALDRASELLLDRMEVKGTLEPVEMMFTILEILNDSAHVAIREISECLDKHSEAVAAASGGFEMSKRQAGVADIADTAIALGEAEELVAKMVEGQLMLARAGRWLRRIAGEGYFSHSLSTLLSDINSLHRYARFQHDKIRNLQESLMTTLDLKQNQVIKVFTVVTAVFTPPTLVAAFYGQNFSYMPELEIPWGEWIVMALTGLFALMPLVYIKRKGWMR